jgi:hypothetical protein
VIGDAVDRAHIIETEDSISAGRLKVKKADLAKLIGCKPEDKCWAVAMSRKPWPKKLTCCNHAGEAGHEHYDSAKHTFTPQEMHRITEYKKKLEGAKGEPT